MPKKKSSPPAKATALTRLLSWGAIIASLGVLLDLIGRFVSGLDFVQYLIEWRAHTLNFIVFGGLIGLLLLLLIVWQLFEKQNSYRFIWLACVVVIGSAGFVIFTSYIRAREEKLIVLITKFDDTNGDYYELRDTIFDSLKSDFENESGVQIEKVDEIITTDQGSDSPRARDLGKSYQADIVIWGSYRKSENPNIKIHIENLSPKELYLLDPTDTLKPRATLSDLEYFIFQQQAGLETSALISFLVGFVNYDAGNYKNALDLLSRALVKLDESPLLINNLDEIYFYRAEARYYLNDRQEAIQDYTHAIQINPKFEVAYNNRGVAYDAIGEHLNAIDDYDRSIEINTEDAVTYYNRGSAYYAIDEYQNAIDDYDRALQIDPDVAEAYNGRGTTYHEIGEYQNAIDDYDRAIEINPEFAEAYNGRGAAYDGMGEHLTAISNYDRAIQINSELAQAYNNRGVAYDAIGEYLNAIDDYDRALQINSEFVEAYSGRGSAYHEIGEYQNAINDYDHAIEINPEFAEAYNGRGMAYHAIGEYLNAIDDYDRTLQINSEFAEAYSGRGSAYHEIGEYQNAINDYDRAIQIDPEFAEAYNGRGTTYHEIGEYQNAIDDYDRAIEINPLFKDAYNNRGIVYQKLGDNTKAASDFAMYTKLTKMDVP